MDKWPGKRHIHEECVPAARTYTTRKNTIIKLEILPDECDTFVLMLVVKIKQFISIYKVDV